MSTPEALPPAGQLVQILSATLAAQAVSVAAELGVADELAHGPQSATDLAAKVGAHGPSLYRLLRALTSVGIVEEHDAERFSLTPVGECLRRDVPSSQRALAMMLGRPWRMAALAELAHAVRTGESSFRKVHGTGSFEWFEANPVDGGIFNDAMTSNSRATAEGVAKAYDFGRFARVADVGGGHGFLLAAILKAHPGVRGVLFDQAHVTNGAQATFAAAGVGDRCEIQSGSFFDEVPQGCDVYAMKHILHDWDDERSVAILRRCRDAMTEDGRVIVLESVLPGPGEPSPWKVFDLQMLALTEGGKERTEREFAELFAASGLALRQVIPTAYRVSIVEATRAPART